MKPFITLKVPTKHHGIESLNHFDERSCQTQLKHDVEIEYQICNKNKTRSLKSLISCTIMLNIKFIYKCQHVQYLSKCIFRKVFV